MLTHRIAQKYRYIDPWNLENGKHWYRHAHSEAVALSRDFSISVDKASAVIAVLSPATSWERNLIDARLICEQGADAIVTTYKANKDKALAILKSRYYSQYVRGHKVRSFYENISHPDTSEAVTLDRHMLRFMLGTNDDKRLNKVFSSSNNYSFYAEYIRRGAAKRGLRPNQLQAMLWLQVRP